MNLVTEKATTGRVYVCTYPTMMGLINETRSGEARFSVGHFDLVIIDEAHRSVYQKYGAIFRYFDSLLVGLTATPREQVDRNTYALFDLEPGVPTDAYELETAVADGFLVPPRVQQVDLQFPREGIDYDSLSDEEQEQWESLDWGDDVDEHGLPDKVNAAAINSWLFNKDTVDKVLQHLMEHGHTVDGGDRLAKTILFARNHTHAQFIEERFNHHYPQHKGYFARVIDHYATYPQSLLDDFSQKDNPPHIAISVDMLDTGIDIPEVANLVFFKPVYSKIKFWQMIGRGTRLCPELFGPGDDKQDFRVFDVCFNFDFFRENPEGIEGRGIVPLGTRLFRARVQLLTHVQATPDLDPDTALADALTTALHGALLRGSKTDPQRPLPTDPLTIDSVRRRPTKLSHLIEDVTCEDGLRLLPRPTARSKALPDDQLVPEEGVLHTGLLMVARVLLPLSPSSLLHLSDRAVARGRSWSPSRHGGCPGRWNDDRRATRTRSLIDATRVVGRVRREAGDVAFDLVDQIEGRRRVVNMPAGQGVSDDHARSVDAQMKLLPAAYTASAMFHGRPFTFTHSREPGTVDDEMYACARGEAAKCKVEVLTTP